jgi:hypothetical protein
MAMRHFPGKYTEDWKAVQAAAVAAAGSRCVRCHHPYVKGAHGNGEWSPCDCHCRHDGKLWVDGKWQAQWRILTCHHFDGNKANNADWNIMALCQRCHLQIQGKVDPETPYFLEHSEWIRPYVGGFYAKKYLGLDLTREETMARLDELLALECRV